MMTYAEMLVMFSGTFQLVKINDYHPVCPELFRVGKVDLTIWIENWNMIVYYLKIESEDKNETIQM